MVRYINLFFSTRDETLFKLGVRQYMFKTERFQNMSQIPQLNISEIVSCVNIKSVFFPVNINFVVRIQKL